MQIQYLQKVNSMLECKKNSNHLLGFWSTPTDYLANGGKVEEDNYAKRKES